VYTQYKVLLRRDISELAQSLIQKAPDAERPLRGDEHSHPSMVVVIKEWNGASTPANILNKFRLIKRKDKLQYTQTKIITSDTFYKSVHTL